MAQYDVFTNPSGSATEASQAIEVRPPSRPSWTNEEGDNGAVTISRPPPCCHCAY
jgi:hypothetical protein